MINQKKSKQYTMPPLRNHPNQKKCPNQRIYLVVVENCVYLVPHIIKKDFIFLKTIIPSRKATKDFLNEQEKRP